MLKKYDWNNNNKTTWTNMIRNYKFDVTLINVFVMKKVVSK